MVEQSVAETKKPALLSIAIPVHNGGHDFERCLEKIARETNVDFHVYIFENASTDGTRAVAEAYAAKDPRFSIRPSEQLLPIIKNFRRAIQEAGSLSKYFCIRCADDYTSDDFLAILVGALENNANAHLAAPRVITTNPDGTIREKQFGPPEAILMDMRISDIRFPAPWYCGIYRSGKATDVLLSSLDLYPYAWGVDRLSIYRIIMDLGAVADSRAIFYCQHGSSSEALYKPRTIIQAITRRIKYYRILKDMDTFKNREAGMKSIFNSRFAWKIAGAHMGATGKDMRKLLF